MIRQRGTIDATRRGLTKRIKKTKFRQRVLTVFEKNNRPMSALEIDQIMKNDGKTIWISTVYRAWGAMEEQKMIFRFLIPDSESAFYKLNQPSHCCYAVCLKCHKMISIHHLPLREIFREEQENFEVTEHNFEIYGYCKHCRTK